MNYRRSALFVVPQTKNIFGPPPPPPPQEITNSTNFIFDGVFKKKKSTRAVIFRNSKIRLQKEAAIRKNFELNKEKLAPDGKGLRKWDENKILIKIRTSCLAVRARECNKWLTVTPNNVTNRISWTRIRRVKWNVKPPKFGKFVFPTDGEFDSLVNGYSTGAYEK